MGEAYALNNSGTVVGTTNGGTGGYRWQPGGTAQALAPLSGDTFVRPLAINNLGVVAGSSAGPSGLRPVTWLGLIPVPVPVPTDAHGGEAWGISDAGAVAGTYHDGSASRPFVWTSATGALPLPLPAGFTRGGVWAINNAGVVVGDVAGRATIWKKNAAGSYDVFLLNDLLVNGTGWSSLALYAINESGQLAGDGVFNGNHRGFIATPGPALVLTLRTDADRSGATDLETAADTTAPGSPFYFWTNDDHDATGDDGEPGAADSSDDRILNPVLVTASGGDASVVRDLEDFARLAFKLTPDLKAALDAGAKLRLEAAGSGTVHLFSTPSADTETRYLTDEPFAVSLIMDVTTDVALPSTVDPNGITRWENIETLIKPADWENGRLRFLWEGVTPGACVLTLKLTQPDDTEIASAPVHVSLHPVRDFFKHVRATPANGFEPPWETNGQTPVMSWEPVHAKTVTLTGEQNVDLVWVHGWRMTEYERQNWAEMMFKRLWHAGYRGRLHAFTWPTLSGDDSFFESGPDGKLSYDRSEFRAWKSGAALDGYLRVLRNTRSGNRLAIVSHSMGNVVTGEALRRGAPADLQIMMQAAVSASCYDVRPVLDYPDLLAKEQNQPTPDFDVELGYRGILSHVTTPTANFYNEADFALQTGVAAGFINASWITNQGTKPDDPTGKGSYLYRNRLPGLYSGKKLLREVIDIHESLAFLARSRTKAVGAESRTVFPQVIQLQRIDLQARFNFTRDASEHSAQFNRPIQRQLVGFYAAIVEIASPSETP